MKPLGLYVHIPFCRRKCHYCNFVSYPGLDGMMDRYIDAVIKEARLYAGEMHSRTVDTVYFGGGTPSLLTPKQLKTLINGLSGVFAYAPSETTIEANPETLDAKKTAGYAKAGVNRLSIGLQTHDDTILARIGRRHTYGDFLRAYDTASRHFNNISVDTIFGLPGQSVDSYLSTIQNILALSPQHVSAYALKLEPGTPLYESYAGADEDTDREMYHGMSEILASAGFIHYETSNFARPGGVCRHNMTYWTGGEYLGLGVAAHSCLAGSRRERFSNTEDIAAYLCCIDSGRKPALQRSMLTAADEETEYIMLRLRLEQGIAFDDYAQRFGQDFIHKYCKAIDIVEKAGLIVRNEKGIAPTLKGFDLQNTLITELIKEI